MCDKRSVFLAKVVALFPKDVSILRNHTPDVRHGVKAIMQETTSFTVSGPGDTGR